MATPTPADRPSGARGPVPSARTQRRERDARIRSEVCGAAARLLEASPFTELTVDAVMREAGLSRSSFYLHFRDKYDVLAAMTEDIVDELYAQADRWWHGTGAPEDLVREALEGLVAIYAENALVLRVVNEATTYDDGFREIWTRLVRRFITATAAHLRQEAAAGRSAVASPDATADALVWMTERFLYVHLARGRWTRPEVVAALGDVWLAGVYGRR